MPCQTAEMPGLFSPHAARRAARRNLVPDEVEYVLTYGRRVQRTGVTFYFLGRRDIPPAARRASWASRLEGTVVLLANDGAGYYRVPGPQGAAQHSAQAKILGRDSMSPLVKHRQAFERIALEIAQALLKEVPPLEDPRSAITLAHHR